MIIFKQIALTLENREKKFLFLDFQFELNGKSMSGNQSRMSTFCKALQDECLFWKSFDPDESVVTICCTIASLVISGF